MLHQPTAPEPAQPDNGGRADSGEGCECNLVVLPYGLPTCHLLGEGPVCHRVSARMDAAFRAAVAEKQNGPHRASGRGQG